MRKRLVRKWLVEKLAQLCTPVSLFPTNHQKIFVNSFTEIREHVAVVSFVSLGRLVVVPPRRFDSKNLVPPVRLYKIFPSDPLTLVMAS